MRVLLFTPTFLPARGGAERVADRLARGLQERGHEVRVLTARLREGPPPADLPYPVRLYRRPPRQHLVPEMLAWPLWREHRRAPPDAVLAFYGYPAGYAAGLLKRGRFGLVVSPRGTDLYENFHALRKPRVRAVRAAGYRAADRVCAPSRWLADRVRSVCGDSTPPIDVVPNGIDLASWDARREAAPPPDLPGLGARRYALSLGRLEAVKDPHTAVRAVAALAPRLRAAGWAVVLAGEGRLRSGLRDEVRARGLEDLCLLPGQVEDARKDALLAHASLFLSASTEEGLPNAVLEGLACGLPVLLSEIGPHRELLDRGPCGQSFPVGDAEALASALDALLARELAPLSGAAREVARGLDEAAMIDGYEAALRSVVAP